MTSSPVPGLVATTGNRRRKQTPRDRAGTRFQTRPAYGVLGEVLLLSLIVVVLRPFGISGPIGALALLVAQALSTFLIHCPAHYATGTALGIRFRSLKLGRSSLGRSLPGPLRGTARLVPVLSLSVDSESLKKAGPARAKAMYLSGVGASVVTAFLFAAWSSQGPNLFASLVAWTYALGYFVSDLALSPKSGDVMRARLVTSLKAVP